MFDPVPASVDLVAAGPDGTAVLYSGGLGEVQWRAKDGTVAGQAVFATGQAPGIEAIAIDAQGRMWAVVKAGTAFSLVRLGVAP